MVIRKSAQVGIHSHFRLTVSNQTAILECYREVPDSLSNWRDMGERSECFLLLFI